MGNTPPHIGGISDDIIGVPVTSSVRKTLLLQTRVYSALRVLLDFFELNFKIVGTLPKYTCSSVPVVINHSITH